MTSTAQQLSSLPLTYEGLVKIRPLRPIRDDVDFEEANRLGFHLDAIESRTPDQDDYLDVLNAITRQYEDKHHSIDLSHVTVVDMLEHYMEIHDMTASDLGRVIGQRTMGQKILSGQRSLSKANILALSKHFHVNPGLFLGLKPAAKPDKSRSKPTARKGHRPALSSEKKHSMAK